MKNLPKTLEKQLTSYVKGNTSHWYMQDLITAYIEKKNLENETTKIKMIMNDLWGAKNSLENGNWNRAKDELAFVKRELLYIK